MTDKLVTVSRAALDKICDMLADLLNESKMKNYYIVVNGSEIHFQAQSLEDAIMIAADTNFIPPLAVFEKETP